MMLKRASGMLLHVSSLPGKYGIGDLGSEARSWIDFLVEAKQSYWQVLPLNPTNAAGHNSPYQGSSTFAGNPLFLSPPLLRDEGLLTDDDLSSFPDLPPGRTDYPRVTAERYRLLRVAYERFKSRGRDSDFEVFCSAHSGWLDDCALFLAIREKYPNRLWSDWPEPLRERDPAALETAANELGDTVEREKFYQYLFHKQWTVLKRYANDRGVRVMGDLPYYVGYDSADVWRNPSLFKLDGNKRLRFVAGVPPDAFSDTGQLWGSPVYDWDVHGETKYAWWIARLRRNLELFDTVRIDHFRAFAAYWEIPAGDETAAGGRWVDCPGDDFFRTLLKYEPYPRLFAEDLGVITPDVRELMHTYGFPGMKVLLFAFDGDSATNPYSLHNHVPHSILYTGTHDNNTARGWFRTEADKEAIRRLSEYLGSEPAESDVHWSLIRMAMMSVSRLVVIPIQDALGLDESARMNRPAVLPGNWEWRLEEGLATPDLARRLAKLVEIYGRA